MNLAQTNPVAAFVETLRQLKLLNPTQLNMIGKGIQACPDAKSLATELVKRGWLTAFQANQLLQGRGQALVLGGYVILDRLGEGGMGLVFKAKHQTMDRTVALKVISKDRLQQGKGLERFQREVRVAAQLNHPNIVRALDADEVAGKLILVMELVEGADLAKIVRQNGPLPVNKACNYIGQAALGLQHALEKGFVHRDIKPSNLLLSKEGAVKILDMGLARSTDPSDDRTLTQEGSVLGTADYISPEQAISAHTVDIRADIYSLGATFYFLLTGQVPFPGGSLAEKLLNHQLHEPQPPDQLRPGVPANLMAIVKKMMAKKPEDRLQTPAEVVAALGSPSKLSKVKGQPGRRQRALVPLIGGLLVLVILGGLGMYFLQDRSKATDQPAVAKNSGREENAANSRAATSSKAKLERKTDVIPEPKAEDKPDPQPDSKATAVVKADPEPQAKPDSKEHPKDEPAKEKRTPVPDAAAQAKAEKVVKDTFKAEYAKKQPADLLALSKKLLQLGLDTKDDPAGRFVALREARDLAAIAGDIALSSKVIEEMDQLYAVDALEMRISALDLAGKSATTQDSTKTIVTGVLALVDQMLEKDNYGTAGRLLKVGESAAIKTRSTALLKSLESRGKEVEALRKDYELVKKAQDTLTKKPDDPEASLVVGKHLCFMKGNWDKGLPLLAVGSDAKLKDLAKKDAAVPTDPSKQVELGDGWYELAAAEKGPGKAQLQLRAQLWYKEALPMLTGLTKAKVEKRIADIEALVTVGTNAREAIDLLKLIDPKKDAVVGTWSFQGNSLVSSSEGHVRVQIPYICPAEYTLSVVTERKQGRDAFVVGLIVGGRQCVADVDGWPQDGFRSGLSSIDGKMSVNNETVRKGQVLKNGNPSEFVYSVRRTGVTVTVDRKPLFSYRGDVKRLSMPDQWTVPDTRVLFIGGVNSIYHITKMELTPISGQGKMLER